MTTPCCEVLAWDSEFFGCRIGRIVPIGATGDRLDRAVLAEVDAWCRTEAIDCLYFLAGSGDPATAALAEESGFRLVDLRVTLEGPLTPGPSPIPVRQSRIEDIPALRRIAAASHHDSRFYADPHFDRGRCDELYATWIEKSCRGEGADVVLVAEADGAAAGYISCRMLSEGTGLIGLIGLIAVDAAARGRGLGGALVGAAQSWLAARGASRVRVATQGRNARAQRFYQAHGLLTQSIGLWFHRWADRSREMRIP
jgi:dTDP-4-amino-4,6-dideoxy-D-galactose acyltransferase